jgi:hypothetical protein
MDIRIDVLRAHLITALVIVSSFFSIGIGLAKADTVRMKNGDVYRGRIIKESFNDSLQVSMGDGSEKHLLWPDIQTVERDEVIPEPKPSETPAPSTPAVFTVQVPPPTEPVAEPFHVELDFTSISFDNVWERASLNNDSVSESAHTLLTSPEDITVRVLPGRWMIQGRYYSNQLNADGSSQENQSFSDLAVAFGITPRFYIGLWGLLNRSSVNLTTGSAISQDYVFGFYTRGIIPLSSVVELELQGALGPDIRAITQDINVTGVSFAATESLYFTFRIAKNIRFLLGVEGWQRIGTLTLNQTQLQDGTPVLGTVDDNLYRLRVVPIGLRIQF